MIMLHVLYIICCFLTLRSGTWGCIGNRCTCSNVVVEQSEEGINVDCSQNDLEYFPPISQGTEKFLVLNFSHNALKEIPNGISNLSELRKLDLSYNMLESITDNVFSTLINLKVLKLNSNYLSELTANTFRGLERLEQLHLGDNMISQLPYGMLQSLSPIIICLGGDNKWNCTNGGFCETLQWYLSMAEKSESNVFCSMKVPSCSSPSNLKERPFTSLSAEDIRECPEGKPMTSSFPFISTLTDFSTVSGSPENEIGDNSLKITFSTPDIDEPTKAIVFPKHDIVDNDTHTGLVLVVAIVLLGAMIFFILLLWKIQRRARNVTWSGNIYSADPIGMNSHRPLMQVPRPLATEEVRAAVYCLTVDYEEIPSNKCKNFDDFDSKNNISEQSIGPPQSEQKGSNTPYMEMRNVVREMNVKDLYAPFTS